ncbi:hypothetical protein V9L05_23255 (plasmid) [Bernardetia sp. Wsw4-3y2]|uniref:DUF6896 domain-containing protein n=1 Tax=Bernardetia sp. Wsw4-3y2 TaxID=3127471 RepID=UPI0030CD33A9
MKELMLQLVNDYVNQIRSSLNLLYTTFSYDNLSLATNKGLIPKSGILDEAKNIGYNFHGNGASCLVYYTDRNNYIDIIFNYTSNRQDEFYLYCLINFAKMDFFHSKNYENLILLSEEKLTGLLEELVSEGKLKREKNRHGTAFIFYMD